MSRITIQTVADKAGVSIKTVSRVINNESSVREATREKVQAVIEELGYEPSPAARALASNSSKIIGLIYDNPSSAYINAVQNGALKACSAAGYNLVIHPCNHESKNLSEELISLVQKSRMNGLILTPPICDMNMVVKDLIAANINVVSIAPAKTSKSIPSVSCNDSEVVREIIHLLIEQGHKRIGFIQGHKSHGAALKRFLGYTQALKEAGIAQDEGYIKQGAFSYESGVVCGRELLKMSKRPTAIFAANDYMAAGVLTAANEMGIKIPEELSLAGFDDAPVASQIWPSLTTVKQPIEKMSEAVVNLLFAKIDDNKLTAEHPEFAAELIVRASTQIS